MHCLIFFIIVHTKGSVVFVDASIKLRSCQVKLERKNYDEYRCQPVQCQPVRCQQNNSRNVILSLSTPKIILEDIEEILEKLKKKKKKNQKWQMMTNDAMKKKKRCRTPRGKWSSGFRQNQKWNYQF